MQILRRALEGEPPSINTEDKMIVITGPMSDVYAEALNIAYAKDTAMNIDQTATEDNSTKKKPAALKIKKGSFHAWLKKKPTDPITDSDIAKGLKDKDPHMRRMAQFAKNAKKWKQGKGKGKKVSTEDMSEISFDEMNEYSENCGEQVAMESQQMDAAMVMKLADAINNVAEPTLATQTVYGVARDDVTEDTIIDVTGELAAADVVGADGTGAEVVVIIDANDAFITGEVEEEIVPLISALECMVKAHGFKVFHSFKEYVNTLR